MYYPCSENKGADQLCSYCTADLRLCFRTSKNLVSSLCGSTGTLKGLAQSIGSYQTQRTHPICIGSVINDIRF